MTALYWQLLILGTIVISFFLPSLFFKNYKISKLLGSIITIFWIAWTLGLSAFILESGWYAKIPSELFFYQMARIIITFVICYYIVQLLTSKDKTITESKEIINKLLNDKDKIDNEEIISYIRQNRNINVEVLSTLSEHRRIFFDTLSQATNSICILSGTATSYVVDEDFKETLKEALKRGVNVYLGYGYKSKWHDQKKKDHEKKAEEDLKKLVQDNLNFNHDGKIFLAEYLNHSKILICDDKYVVCGSFNWLSKARGYNDERSFLIRDKNLVLKESQQVKKFIKSNIKNT